MSKFQALRQAGRLNAVMMMALGLSALAQNIPSVGDTTAPPAKTPGHALIQGPHETVNPANGQVSLRFEVPLPAGRQLTPRFAFAYDSAGAHFVESDPYQPRVATLATLLSSDGWSYTVPSLSYNTLSVSPDDASTCTVSTNYVYQGDDGNRQTLELSVVGYASRPAYDDPCDQNLGWSASSAMGGWLATTGSIQDAFYRPQPVSVTDPDGTEIDFISSSTASYGEVAYQMTDRNGNAISISSNSSTGAVTYTDTLGRTALTSSGFNQGTDTVAVAGMSSAYTASWAAQGGGATVSMVGAGTYPCSYTSATSVNGGNAITSLTTPEGTYTFSYDASYGLLDRITYPNGGYVRYVWGFPPQSNEAGEFAVLPVGPGNPPGICFAQYATPVVTDRYVSADGSTEIEHQHFGYTTTWGTGAQGTTWSDKTTTVTTTDTSTGASRVTEYDYQPKGALYSFNSDQQISTQMPFENTVTTNPGASQRVVTETWTSSLPYQLASQETTLDNLKVDETTLAYNANDQLTEKDEYDFGAGAPGPLLRKTTVGYATFAGTNIVDRPSSEVIYAADGATRVAETDYAYDSKANLTSSARWVSAAKGFLTTTYTNDAYGNRLTAKDPANNTTQFDYTNTWAGGGGPSGSGAYVTTITDALGHTDHYAWNYAGGTLASHTDQNNNLTSFVYSDSWDRLTQVNYPDLGETTFAYTPSTLETKRLQDTSGDWMDELDSFDGLGRPIVAATETSPGQWSRVDTQYNGFGERLHVTYPYYWTTPGAPANNSEPGDSFQYDALGRQTLATHPDSTTFITSYAGRATETADEGDGANRITKITQENGLGQLTAVCEVITNTPPTQGPGTDDCGSHIAGGLDIDSTSGYLTTYADDALGNLRTVTQGGETRNFIYDGLSRLLSANNPETGITSYLNDTDPACTAGWGTNGDEASRLDARGIRTCYQHDALHRVLTEQYSDGTPTAVFAYDASSELGVQLSNTVGRLAEECTSGCAATTELFGYDQMGRGNYTDVCAPSGCAAGAYSSTWQIFDRAGDLTESEVGLPGPHYTVLTSALDLAGRPTSLTSSVAGALISSVSRDARGQEIAAMLGNGLAETRSYDPRGRETSVTDGAAYSLSGVNHAPNGDLLQAVDGANGTFVYSYNDLNQLTQACTPNCSGNVANYAYDRYGNRWSGGPVPLSFYDNNNRMDANPPYLYDAAGNLLNDGVHTYAYDAENRLISVDGGATASYVYDAEGRRAHENVGGVVKEYVYGQGGQELSVVDANQNLLQGETYLVGRYLGTATPSGFAWAQTDELGTVRARTNSSGGLTETDTSWPFGEYLNQVGVTSNLHFTGKYRDGETGLDYFGARYYNSSLGRFLTPDWSDSPEPIPYADLENPQSLNLYSYVLNNPVTSTDANGHYSDLVFDGATHTITLLDRNGNVIGRWPAADNVDSRATIGKLVDGTYQFFDTTSPHLHGGSADTANGAFGPDGVFRLKEFRGADGKEHVGVGVHAGKEGVPDGLKRTGPEHATMGCLRTCGAATGAIRQLITSDPLETLRVINNRRLKMCKEGTPCGGSAPKTASPTKPLPDAGGGQLLLLVAYHPPLQRKRPENYKAESTLSGVTVGSTTVAQVIAALGPPEKVEEKSGPDFPKGSGSRAYTWTRGHVIMQVAAEFYRDSAGRRIESAVQSVQVWGHEANGQIGMTGRGIALGSQISSAQRVYGRDCSSGKYKHGSGNQNTHGFLYVYYLEYPRANYEQENGALFIDADARGRIVHMSVIGPV